MIVDLAAYRQKKAKRIMSVCAEQHERLCVNSGLAQVIPVQAAMPVEPIASPTLADLDGDCAAFHALAYALASQI